MAASAYRPARTLGILIAILFALALWWLWPFANASITPNLGLDLRGGTSVTLKPQVGQGEITEEQINQAVAIIRQRVNSLGVAEAVGGQLSYKDSPNLTELWVRPHHFGP